MPDCNPPKYAEVKGYSDKQLVKAMNDKFDLGYKLAALRDPVYIEDADVWEYVAIMEFSDGGA